MPGVVRPVVREIGRTVIVTHAARAVGGGAASCVAPAEQRSLHEVSHRRAGPCARAPGASSPSSPPPLRADVRRRVRSRVPAPSPAGCALVGALPRTQVQGEVGEPVPGVVGAGDAGGAATTGRRERAPSGQGDAPTVSHTREAEFMKARWPDFRNHTCS